MYIFALKRYYWIILVCTALTTLTGFIITRLHPQTYQASSTLLVSARPPGSSITAIEPAPDPLQSLAEANTYAAEIQSHSLLTTIYQATPDLAKHGITLNTFTEDISTSASTTAAIITINAIDPNAVFAQLIANDTAQGFQTYVQQQFQASLDSVRHSLQNTENHYTLDKNYWEEKMQSTRVTDPRYDIYVGNRDQAVRSIDAVREQFMQLPVTVPADVSVTQLATLHDVKNTVARSDVMIAVTLGLGLFVGILLMLLIIYVDDRLLQGEQVKEKFGMAYLGSLSHHRNIASNSMPVAIQRELADVYANLHLTKVLPYNPQSPRSAALLVTSAREAEGKTTVASALALEIARNGGSVVVVDGNLARPSTHMAFSMRLAGPGLSGLLLAPAGSGQLDTTVLRCNVPGIWLLPGGPPMEEPAAMLEKKLPAILAQLRQKTDIVIIDGPSLLSGAEASVIASMVDSVALVVDSRHSKVSLLQKAKELLRSLTNTPAGIIINHVPKASNYYYATAYPGASLPTNSVTTDYPHTSTSTTLPVATRKTPTVVVSQLRKSTTPVLTTRFGGPSTPLRLPTYAPASKPGSKSLLQRPAITVHSDMPSPEE